MSVSSKIIRYLHVACSDRLFSLDYLLLSSLALVLSTGGNKPTRPNVHLWTHVGLVKKTVHEN